MDNIKNNIKQKIRSKSKTLDLLNKIKTKEFSPEERFNNAKVVDIEDSTRFLEDNSFHERHEEIMKYKDNLNEDEIKDPDEEKQNYYGSNYWQSNGIIQTLGENEYFYDYDNKNNEIIICNFRRKGDEEVSYVEDLNEKEKQELKEVFFYGHKKSVDIWDKAFIKNPNELNDLLGIVHSDYEDFKFKGNEYSIRWDIDTYFLYDNKGELSEFKSNEKVIDYFKELDGVEKLPNGYTKKDTIDFLQSHPEIEHIEMDLKDKDYNDLYDMNSIELCNFADKYGMEDGDDEEKYYMLDRNGIKHPGNGQSGYCGKCGKELPNPDYSSNCHNCNTKLI